MLSYASSSRDTYNGRVLACKSLGKKEAISRRSRKSICHAWRKLTILLRQRWWCPKQQSSCGSCHSTSSVMPSICRWIEKNSEACCLPSTPMGISALLQLSFLKVIEKSWNFFPRISGHLTFGAQGSGLFLYQIRELLPSLKFCTHPVICKSSSIMKEQWVLFCCFFYFILDIDSSITLGTRV